jgi:hypothetical protein
LNFGKDVAISMITNDNLTYLMSNLDKEKNLNLFDIVDFLSKYHLDDYDHTSSHDIINIYGKLIHQIRNDGYKEKVKSQIEKSDQKLNIEDVEYIPTHLQMIDNFNKLPNNERKNIIYLAWFILYCKIYKLDHPDQYSPWKRYLDLIEKIQNFSDYENAWI